jgi:hypothetical protein
MKREPYPDRAPAPAQQSQHQEMWLLGQAPLRKYLDFVDDMGLDFDPLGQPRLVREWSAAASYYEELARGEAGIADRPACPPLDPAMLPLAEQAMAGSRFTRTFDCLPARIAMVDLGRLVVCQNHVTRSFVDQLKARLGQDPDPAALFRFCLPFDARPEPVQIREAGSQRYLFRSDSTDFRFHEPVLLDPQQLPGYAAFGPVAGVLGLVVGFSCNFLNAVCDDDSGRMLLHNGYHRACALLELGVTHAPCVVQRVSSRDELDIVAKPVVADNPGYFFNAPRPPLMKDFLDRRIRKLVPIKKMSRVIEVSFDVRDYFVED